MYVLGFEIKSMNLVKQRIEDVLVCNNQ